MGGLPAPLHPFDDREGIPLRLDPLRQALALRRNGDKLDPESEGLLDGLDSEPQRQARADLLKELAADGATVDELREAIAQDRLTLLPLERAMSEMGEAKLRHPGERREQAHRGSARRSRARDRRRPRDRRRRLQLAQGRASQARRRGQPCRSLRDARSAMERSRAVAGL